MTEIRIITTDDGSSSLYLPDLNETYHSFHGALQESQYVYINMGLAHLKTTNAGSLQVLEVGFGTGLNVLLAAKWAEENDIVIEMDTLEPFPLASEIWQQLNYSSILGIDNQKILPAMHQQGWNSSEVLTKHLQLRKYQQGIQDFKPAKVYDCVFYDAFAPNKQAEMWSPDIFQKLAMSLRSQGILVTYCAKGQVKRDLKAAGFVVETLQGPPGKMEMIRAVRV